MTIREFIERTGKREDVREIVHTELLARSSASFSETARPLPKAIRKRLEGLGVEKLYTHQARGMDVVRQGGNAVIMTPTASGKSLIYNVPVVEALMDDPASHALYVFPLKGLEQDQLKTLREFTSGLPMENPCEIYDGDTPRSARERIRSDPPSVVFTNPDMLHTGICAYHDKWEPFFRGLRYVILDELHTYRGVLGSHVAQVMRRLRRIAAHYGSEPVFIASSATIANPLELARTLTGREFELVTDSGAPQGRKYFLFLNPALDLSPYSIATRLFIESVRAGFKTIAFTKSRKITELMHAWTARSAPELMDSVSSYRAGFLPQERREIEGRLFSGGLAGVISTSALELGVDIGGLDVCILVGYPGTISSTWQRAGRVGRAGRDSLIIMVGLEDALDQHFMRRPAEFFRKPVEAAVLDLENPLILKSHLLCAAAELPVGTKETVYDMETVTPLLAELTENKKIWYSGIKGTWNPRGRYPHRGVSIRGAGETYRILTEDGKLLGESSPARVLKELHPGAVYLHRGVQYRVMSLHVGKREAVCRRTILSFYTTPITDEETEILSDEATRELEGFAITIGKLRITEHVHGYRKKDITTRKVIDEYPLDLPAHVFTTIGVWIKVNDGILEEARALGYSDAGGLHALEHAAIAALPLYAMCDRNDLGGVSYPMNPELMSPAVFIYDGHDGGIGLTRRGFEVPVGWLGSTLGLMRDCPCEVSCPSCTQDPHCGNNNNPLDKRAAMLILKRWNISG